RYVRDRALGHALSEAYRGLLMVGRMPLAFLYLEIPPEEVDVNVHPTKVEVRFRDAHRIYNQLLSTVRQTFLASDLHSRLQSPPPRQAPTQGLPPRALQVHDSYLIAETEEGMVVIDQHALHERILYEELRARVGEGRVESQRLLIPEPVDLSAAEAAEVLER